MTVATEAIVDDRLLNSMLDDLKGKKFHPRKARGKTDEQIKTRQLRFDLRAKKLEMDNNQKIMMLNHIKKRFDDEQNL